MDEWDQSLDNLIGARKRWKEMRGKPDEELSRQDYVKAHKAYDEATERALKDA